MADKPKPSKASTRQRAEEARKAAEAAQRRIDVRNRVIGGVVIVAVVVAIFGGVWWSKRGSSDPGVNPSVALPTGVTSANYGVPYGTGTSKVPQLQLWEDFQCPYCSILEQTNGKGITGLADQGKIQLLWRPATFLDDNFSNDASARAAAAWGCAIDAGKAKEYHSVVFANNPALANPDDEGKGYTDAQLLQFGKDAGITGAAYDTFTACVAKKTYAGWVANSAQAFNTEGVTGTPTGYLIFNGKTQELDYSTLKDQALLEAAIANIQAP